MPRLNIRTRKRPARVCGVLQRSFQESFQNVFEQVWFQRVRRIRGFRVGRNVVCITASSSVQVRCALSAVHRGKQRQVVSSRPVRLLRTSSLNALFFSGVALHERRAAEVAGRVVMHRRRIFAVFATHSLCSAAARPTGRRLLSAGRGGIAVLAAARSLTVSEVARPVSRGNHYDEPRFCHIPARRALNGCEAFRRHTRRCYCVVHMFRACGACLYLAPLVLPTGETGCCRRAARARTVPMPDGSFERRCVAEFQRFRACQARAGCYRRSRELGHG